MTSETTAGRRPRWTLASVRPVGDVSPAVGRLPGGAVGDEFEATGTEAVVAVEEAATEHGVEATVTVTRGTAHEEIVRYAADYDIDVIVMGSRGARASSRSCQGPSASRWYRPRPSPC